MSAKNCGRKGREKWIVTEEQSTHGAMVSGAMQFVLKEFLRRMCIAPWVESYHSSVPARGTIQVSVRQ
jgi:hypothetical protein